MNRNCSACDKKIDKNIYKKDRTVCKSCYNGNKRKENKTIVPYQQSKSGNGNKNNNTRTPLVGPSFSGKTYLMLKTLSRIQLEIFI